MKIRLNLATSPPENYRRFALGVAVIGGLALAGLLALSWHTYGVWHRTRDHRAKMDRMESEIVTFRQQRRDLEQFFNRPETVQQLDRAAFLNGLIEQRSFPWTKIFMDLERDLPEGVRVISIAPRMNEGRVEVKLSVGAASDEAKLKFLRALEKAPEFSRIQLLSETRPTASGETDVVRVELVAWYATT